MNIEKVRLLKEGVWITIGQGVAAIATLMGLRLITEFVSPSLYGAFALINGVLALLQGMVFQPLSQAALRYYPEYEAEGVPHLLRQWLIFVFKRRWQWILGACFVMALVDGTVTHYVGPVTLILIGLSAGLDAWKTVEIVMRNAAQKQTAYATLLGLDALLRITGSVLVAWLIGPSLELLLIGQAAGALIALVMISFIQKPSYGSTINKDCSKTMVKAFENNMRSFAAPLIWLPLFGWISGLADRYIVGGILGLDAAGIYAAAYGLSSRPLLMIGAITDASLRQPLYTAVSMNHNHSITYVFRLWITFNIIAGLGVTLLLAIEGDIIAKWLLAPEYRSQSAVMFPLISLGYVFVLINQVMERILYAKHRTISVFFVEAIGSVMAICGAFIGSILFGLKGVAAAVPIYFAVQLAITIFIVFYKLGSY